MEAGLILERAEPRWRGRAIVAASGPSLTPEVAGAVRGERRIIAVNDAWRLLPWAAALYACDAAWWQHHRGCAGFAGERWTSHGAKNDKRAVADRFGLRVVAGSERPGFSRDPAQIHYGNNSGFQAVNLALLWGADPIVLIGFDMRQVDGKSHFFGEHPPALGKPAPWSLWIENFKRAAALLGKPARPAILNATPHSALTCFPAVDLAEIMRE